MQMQFIIYQYILVNSSWFYEIIFSGYIEIKEATLKFIIKIYYLLFYVVIENLHENPILLLVK